MSSNHSFMLPIWGYNHFLSEQITAYDSFVQAILSNYDQNEDGRLSYQEFLIYIMDREKKWKIDFHALDRNKCGKLSVTNSLSFLFFKNETAYSTVELAFVQWCTMFSQLQNKV